MALQRGCHSSCSCGEQQWQMGSGRTTHHLRATDAAIQQFSYAANKLARSQMVPEETRVLNCMPLDGRKCTMAQAALGDAISHLLDAVPLPHLC
jgi:hypothetical protein